MSTSEVGNLNEQIKKLINDRDKLSGKILQLRNVIRTKGSASSADIKQLNDALDEDKRVKTNYDTLIAKADKLREENDARLENIEEKTTQLEKDKKYQDALKNFELLKLDAKWQNKEIDGLKAHLSHSASLDQLWQERQTQLREQLLIRDDTLTEKLIKVKESHFKQFTVLKDSWLTEQERLISVRIEKVEKLLTERSDRDDRHTEQFKKSNEQWEKRKMDLIEEQDKKLSALREKQELAGKNDSKQFEALKSQMRDLKTYTEDAIAAKTRQKRGTGDSYAVEGEKLRCLVEEQRNKLDTQWNLRFSTKANESSVVSGDCVAACPVYCLLN